MNVNTFLPRLVQAAAAISVVISEVLVFQYSNLHFL